MPTILVATDFSDCAADAAVLGANVAQRYKAGIELVHVAKPGARADRAPLEVQLDEASAKIRRVGIDAVTARLLTGNPDEAIVAHAAQIDANMVVMGTNGRRGFPYAFIGSNAEKVVRRAPCPVLTMRLLEPAAAHAHSGAKGDRRRITNILVPTDFSTHAAAALRQASDLARHYDARVTIMHIYLRASFIPSGTTAAVPTTSMEQALGQMTSALEAQRADAEGYGATRITTTLIHGLAEADIVRQASEGQFDLIVMGTHGRTGLKRALMGSIAEHVVRDATCPVLTVRDTNATE